MRSPGGFATRAYDPVLHVGSLSLTAHKTSPTAGFYGLVFFVSPEQFASLDDGADIHLAYGSRTSLAFGALDKRLEQTGGAQ